MPEQQSISLCAHCGAALPEKRNSNRRFCNSRCADKARNRAPGQKERVAAYRNQNRERIRKQSREYMRKKLALDPAYKQRQREAQKRWKLANPDKVTKHRANESRRKYAKHESHVRLWKRLRLDRVHHCDQHVRDWKRWRQSLTPGQAARYWKRVGMAWRNPYLSNAKQYAVRYRLDEAYRLGEINRQSWRKETLKERDDGTINFWQLLRERKTCPYCGTDITKDNAVADHMDPLKLGGANSQHNLTICCRTCNTSKSGRSYLEWVDMLPKDRQNAAMLWYKKKHKREPMQQELTFVF